MYMTKFDPKFLAEKTWDLYQTHGVPFEVSFEILEENGLKLDHDLLNQLIESHQKQSQNITAGQFKAGVGEITNKTKALHTLTHLLHKALKEKYGDRVNQIGSSITNEKARFDISIPASEILDSDINEIQNSLNQQIKQNLKMYPKEYPLSEANKLGAIGLFGEKYGEIVTIYTLEDEQGKIYSREFCSGPHIENTAIIKEFKILKKKSIGSGQTRIEFDVIL
jgi:alanyl-tRNA synthetase